ncbi:MAG: tRNA (adenosine(37)-N6)-threonylcarbamoyltransferase complex ATPase subunit type 1 TsaE, partial [Methylococcaceae bacterium]
MKQRLADETETLAMAARLTRHITPGSVVFLKGNLGAGKTTLVRGYLRALGYQGAVKSPTFTLVEEYPLPTGTVYHFDLYRLAHPEELYSLGISDYLTADAISFIEWPERGLGVLPEADLTIKLHIDG